MGNSNKVGLYCRLANYDGMGTALCVEKTCFVAKKLGYENPAVYFDNGKSGLDFNRAELLRLESDVDRGVIDTIVTLSTDRIGRDICKTIEWIRRLESKGAKVIIRDLGYGM